MSLLAKTIGGEHLLARGEIIGEVRGSDAESAACACEVAAV